MRISLGLGAIVLSLAATATLSAQSQTLATTMAGGNGGSANWTNQMDWTTASAIRVVSLDLNISSGAGTAGTIDIYTTAPGSTYVGNELNPGAWTLVSSGNPVTSNGTGVASVCTLTTPWIAPVGTYGVAIHYIGVSMAYTNGNGANQSFSDTFLKIDLGVSTTAQFGGSIFNPRVWNGAVNYDPAAGLFPAFSAAPTSGVSPLAVQFTDGSYSSAAGGVAAWGWDFDNNGVVDSTVQNPNFTYFGGVWDVSLTVADGMHPPGMATELGLIQVDLVEAEFSAAPLTGASPLLCTFADLSTGPVAIWNWDFDNDGVVDSTVQNPSYTYALPGKWTVVLGVGNATAADTVTKADYIETDKIVASFTSSTNKPALNTVVTFTDTSTGPVIGWSWDLDGDGSPDVATQNANFGYAVPGLYNVTLTITNGFATDSASEVMEVAVPEIPAGPFARTYSGGTTRGFWFQAPVAFTMIGAEVYNETARAMQNIEIINLGSAPPAYPLTRVGDQKFYASMVPANQVIPMSVSFAPGDFIGVLGACGDTSGLDNSYGNSLVASTVLGQAITLTRFGTQFNIATAGNNPYWEESAGPIARSRILVSDAAAVDYGDASDNGLGNGAPTMTSSALPRVGATAVIEVTNPDAGSISATMIIGFGRTPLVTPFGTINVASIQLGAAVPGFTGAGTFPFAIAIPNTPALIGGPTNFQSIILNPTAPAFFGMTNGVELYIGS